MLKDLDIMILYEPLVVFEARWPVQTKMSCFRGPGHILTFGTHAPNIFGGNF